MKLGHNDRWVGLDFSPPDYQDVEVKGHLGYYLSTFKTYGISSLIKNLIVMLKVGYNLFSFGWTQILDPKRLRSLRVESRKCLIS